MSRCHRYHWQKNGHQLRPYNPYHDDLLAITQQYQPDIILVINPNNPTGHLHSQKLMFDLLKTVESYGGLLIIDEAFMDATPQNSLSTHDSDSLIILRSMGKFFGLPGIRTGFVIANQHWRDRIESALGPWALSGPSQWIATQCLNDKQWQAQAITFLKQQSAQQASLLSNEFSRLGIKNIDSTDYFSSFLIKKRIADKISDHLSQQGILIRKIELDDQHSLLRFGLCANDTELARLQKALSCLGLP